MPYAILQQLPRLDIVMQQSTLRYNLAWAAFSRNDSVKALHWAREGMRWRFILVCYILTEQSKTALLDKRDEKAGEAGPGHRGSSSTSFESAVASAASLLSGHSSYATASQHSLGSTVSSQATAESKDTGLGGEIKPGAGPRTVTLTAKQDALMRVLPSALSVAGYKAQSTKGAEGQEASSEVVKAPDPNQWQIIGDYLESLHQVCHDLLMATHTALLSLPWVMESAPHPWSLQLPAYAAHAVAARVYAGGHLGRAHGGCR